MNAVKAKCKSVETLTSFDSFLTEEVREGGGVGGLKNTELIYIIDPS